MLSSAASVSMPQSRAHRPHAHGTLLLTPAERTGARVCAFRRASFLRTHRAPRLAHATMIAAKQPQGVGCEARRCRNATVVEQCMELRLMHSVRSGVSWGTLSPADKRRWIRLECDSTDPESCSSSPPCGLGRRRICSTGGVMCQPILPGQEPKGLSHSLFQPTCTHADHGWPRFYSHSALASHSRWARYIKSVYGELPPVGDFPVCTFDFWSIDKPKWDAAGIKEPLPVRTRMQPKNNQDRFQWTDGELFGRHVEDHPQFYHGFAIYHSDRPYVRHNQWVEVTHHRATNTRGTADEATGKRANMWFTYTPGSGIWYWTGRTALFDSHPAAARILCPNVTDAEWAHTALTHDDYLAVCARRAGYDTVAFRSSHYAIQSKACDPHNLTQCPTIATTDGTVATFGMVGMLELFATRLSGRWSCGQESNGPLKRFRAGWRASRACICNNSHVWLNCL